MNPRKRQGHIVTMNIYLLTKICVNYKPSRRSWGLLASAVAWIVFCLSAEVVIFLALRHPEISINNKSKNYRGRIIADPGFKGQNNAVFHFEQQVKDIYSFSTFK